MKEHEDKIIVGLQKCVYDSSNHVKYHLAKVGILLFNNFTTLFCLFFTYLIGLKISYLKQDKYLLILAGFFLSTVILI